MFWISRVSRETPPTELGLNHVMTSRVGVSARLYEYSVQYSMVREQRNLAAAAAALLMVAVTAPSLRSVR
jgi:hypothetical protein